MPYETASPFAYRTRVAFHQADPAGVLFFGRYAELWQEAYEAFIADLGIDYADWFGQTKRSTPIRRVEVDHLAPIFAGEAVRVRVSVARVGTTSFTLAMTACGVGANSSAATVPDSGDDVRARALITFVYTAAAADGRFAPTALPDGVRSMLMRAASEP